ncbi:MAG: stage III sporulation protein AC [Eubacteriales bacterium]|nr:stage III sporulation protein AC [Eubacteriales bacterium]
MGIELILKIAAVGIVAAILNQILTSNDRKEIAMLTNLTAIVVVIMMIISEISVLFETIKTLFQF